MPAPRAAIIRKDADHTVHRAWGVTVRVLLSAEETGGKYSILDYNPPPNGLGPALHFHPETDETFHVIDGDVHFQIDDERFVASAGTIVHAAPGVKHAFWNVGPKPARMHVTLSPGGFEAYFAELAELAKTHPTFTPDLRPALAKISEKYDTVNVGPPPGAS